MMKFPLLTFLSAAFVLSSTSEAQTVPQPAAQNDQGVQRHRWVLTVGITQYEDPSWDKINAAERSARELNDLLAKQFGFTPSAPPLLGPLARKEDLKNALNTLAAAIQPEDDVVFIFVGHGITSEDGRSGFLVPYNGKRDLTSSDTLIPLTPLLHDLAKLAARHILVILDACHSGQAVPLALGSQPINDATRLPDMRIARIVIASASPYESAIAEGPGGDLTTFAGALIDVLQTGECDLSDDGYCTATELGLLVRRKVLDQSKSRQTPMVGPFEGDENADFQFEIAATVRDDWITAKKNVGDKRGQLDRVRTFLQQYATGVDSTVASDRYVRWYRRAAERLESDLVSELIELHQPVPVRDLGAVPAGKDANDIVVDQDGTRYRWIKADSPSLANSGADHQPVGGFWMGDREVTVGAFKVFLNDPTLLPTAPAFNPHWKDSYPMVNVSLRSAELYCELRHARLPTRAEWKYAARAGTEPGSGLPWNSLEPDANRANIEGFKSGRYPLPVTDEDVKSGNRMSDWKLFDMLGNVSEWTSDRTGGNAWVAGGSFADLWKFIENDKNWFSISEPLGSNTVGFRCVANPSRMQ